MPDRPLLDAFFEGEVPRPLRDRLEEEGVLRFNSPLDRVDAFLAKLGRNHRVNTRGSEHVDQVTSPVGEIELDEAERKTLAAALGEFRARAREQARGAFQAGQTDLAGSFMFSVDQAEDALNRLRRSGQEGDIQVTPWDLVLFRHLAQHQDDLAQQAEWFEELAASSPELMERSAFLGQVREEFEALEDAGERLVEKAQAPTMVAEVDTSVDVEDGARGADEDPEDASEDGVEVPRVPDEDLERAFEEIEDEL